MAQRRFHRFYPAHVKAMFRVKLAVFLAQAPAALRNNANAAPGAVARLKHIGQKFLRGQVALLGDSSRVGVLHFGLAVFQLAHSAPYALQNVKGFKTGHDNRRMKPLGQFGYCQKPITLHTCPAAKNASDAVGGRGHDGLNRGRHQHMRDEHREIFEALLLRHVHGHRVGRGGGLKANRKNTTCLDGFSRAMVTASSGNPDDAHIAALALDSEQIFFAARHAQHVSKATKDDIRRAAIANARSITSRGVTHTGQPGP